MAGKLIAIEGMDGSGKETQTALLKKALQNKGLKVESVSFPCYGQPSAILAEEYLQGSFGKDPKLINAYGASTFFAMDRFVSYLRDWESLFESCDYLIADRYTTSNAIYQCSKLPHEEWNRFLEWLFDFEYTKLGLPSPDLVFYLRIDLEHSQKLLEKRYGNDDQKKDIHEHDLKYLQESLVAADFCSEYCGWQLIECLDGNELRGISDIHREIFERLNTGNVD